MLVLLFTGLIWWTADQSVRERRDFSVQLRVLKSPGLAIAIRNPAPPHEFSVRLSGSKRQLDAFERALTTHSDTLDYRLPSSDAVTGTSFTRIARDVIDQTNLLIESGLTVLDVTPREIVFRVDRLESKTVTVEPDFGSIRVDNWSALPPRVTVTMSATELAELHGVLRPRIEAQLMTWRREHPDEREFDIAVTLALPQASIEPSSVTVAGRIIQLMETRTFGPVPILPAVPVSIQRKYLVEPAGEGEFRTDLSIRGPRGRIETLLPDEIRAYFDVLTADERQAQSGEAITRRIVVVLPDGFELDGPAPEVTFRLAPRKETGDGG